MTQDSNMEDE